MDWKKSEDQIDMGHISEYPSYLTQLSWNDLAWIWLL